MDQQINLYLPEFRTKADPLTVALLTRIVGGVVALILLVSGYNLFVERQLGSELAQLRATLEEETRRTSDLDEQLASRSENQGLQERLAAAESRLDASRQIRDFFSRTQLGNVDGFSDYFEDLARAGVEGLSISEFSFENGGSAVRLTGEVMSSALVPRYVANLGTSISALKQLRFNPEISRPDPQERFFQFRLSTSNE
ncbi:MAG: hypothetical protein WD396_10095 [Pseudohongiellaceae bacterium]